MIVSLSVDELLKIQDLPAFLRAEHCYNDLQHAMLVILFRHGLTALSNNDKRYADQLIDSMSLYLYIHFLNEEEGMVFNMTRGLIEREGLAEHSEMHIDFLDYWKNQVMIPHKSGQATTEQTRDALANFYNLLIKHIDGTDKAFYGTEALSVEQVRTELARVSLTNMPMSPFMAGAYDTVKILAPDVAASLDIKRLSPIALRPMGELNLIANVGRVLNGKTGSLRDTFTAHTRGDQSEKDSAPRIYRVA